MRLRSRDRRAAILVAVAIFAAALSIGSALRWGACLAAALALACGIPYVRSSRTFAGGLRRAPLLLAIAIALAATAVQLVPLPAPIVALLSPARHQLSADTAAALGEAAPALVPLTLDAPATLVELAKLAGYAFFAAACLRLSAAGAPARKAMLGAIALTGAAVALTALGHRAVGATALFGVYEPELARPAYLSPFLNPNHLSAYMALAAAAALGLGLAAAGPLRLAHFAVALLCAGVGLLAGSRGGALALVAGGAAAAGFFALSRPRRRRRPARSNAVAIGVVTACVLVLLAALTAEQVIRRLAQTSIGEESRLDAWASALELLGDYPATGVGRGAFIHAFPRVHDSDVTFAYLENGYLQVPIDWGVPAAVALAAALGLLAAAVLRRAARGGPVEAGALGGLAALAVHNTVDFNLEMPGVALAAIAAAACLLPPGLARPQRLRGRSLAAARIGGLAAGAAAIALAASPVGALAREESRPSATDDVSVAAAARAFERHPADAKSAGVLANAMRRAGDSRALRLANRALYLHPTHPDLHLLAARVLAASERPEQALVEYALALRHGGSGRILDELVARFPDPSQAARGLPLDAESVPRALRRARQRSPELGLHYVRRVQRMRHRDADVLLAVAEFERRHGEPSRAIAAAREARDLEPGVATAIALARSLEEAGDPAGAAAALKSAAERSRPAAEQHEILVTLADIERRAGDREAARDALERASELVVAREAAARVHRKLAKLEDELGNEHRAAWHRRRAEQLARR